MTDTIDKTIHIHLTAPAPSLDSIVQPEGPTREHFEWAARAVGLNLIWSQEEGWSPRIHRKGELPRAWNPFTDNGDAFALLVDLLYSEHRDLATYFLSSPAAVKFIFGSRQAGSGRYSDARRGIFQVAMAVGARIANQSNQSGEPA